MGLINRIRNFFKTGSSDASVADDTNNGVSSNSISDTDLSAENTDEILATPPRNEMIAESSAPTSQPTRNRSGINQPSNTNLESAKKPPANSSVSSQSEYTSKVNVITNSVAKAAVTDDERKPSSSSEIPKAPSFNAPKKQIGLMLQKASDSKSSVSMVASTTPQKEAAAKSSRVIKRPPDEYYLDTYSFSLITMSADEYFEVSDIQKIKPTEVSVREDNGKIDLIAGSISLGSVNSFARSELTQLLKTGYSVRVTAIKVEESSELTYRRFDKDLGMAWEEYETTYDVHVTFELSKPQELIGEAIAVSSVSSTKGSAKKRKQVRSTVAAKCQSRTLYPSEGIAVELTALSCTKPEIAQAMGWTTDDVGEYLRSAYKKLKVHSKAELDKLIKVLSGEGDEEESFSFSIAGTWYHQNEAKGLLKAKAADLRAVREPYNPHDRNAVRIELPRGTVGYVPKRLSRDVAILIDAGFKPVFTMLSASTHFDTEYYWDEWDIRRERETKRKIVDAAVTLVCKNPYVKKKEVLQPDDANSKGADKPIKKELGKAEIAKGVAKLRKKRSLNPNEVTVIEKIAIGLTRTAISKELGWTINKVKDNAKSAYRKLGIHSKDELRDLIEAEAAMRKSNSKEVGQDGEPQAKAKRSAAKRGPEKSYIGIGDFIVRTHRYSTAHKGHTMDPVEAKVNVLVAGKYLSEKEFRAFYCLQCKKYFVTDTTYEKLRRSGPLCCRVVEFDDVFNPKKGKGFASDFAAESTIHQFGYNVNKGENLSSGERQAILSFIIENKIMETYDIVSFIEGLISLRSGNPHMADSISKWKTDIDFLEHYHPPKQSLKVGTMYAKKR